MNLISWDNSLSVNVEKIDKQHQKLIEMINQLHSKMKEGKGNKFTEEIIGKMAEYTKIHFSTEEKYFDLFDFEESDKHKAEHKAFIEKVAEFQDKLKKGELSLSIEVLSFLTNWLTNHIKGSDKKYTKCFNEHGLR